MQAKLQMDNASVIQCYSCTIAQLSKAEQTKKKTHTHRHKKLKDKAKTGSKVKRREADRTQMQQHFKGLLLGMSTCNKTDSSPDRPNRPSFHQFSFLSLPPPSVYVGYTFARSFLPKPANLSEV